VVELTRALEVTKSRRAQQLEVQLSGPTPLQVTAPVASVCPAVGDTPALRSPVAKEVSVPNSAPPAPESRRVSGHVGRVNARETRASHSAASAASRTRVLGVLLAASAMCALAWYWPTARAAIEPVLASILW
jgi:hypothetical protein